MLNLKSISKNKYVEFATKEIYNKYITELEFEYLIKCTKEQVCILSDEVKNYESSMSSFESAEYQECMKSIKCFNSILENLEEIAKEYNFSMETINELFDKLSDLSWKVEKTNNSYAEEFSLDCAIEWKNDYYANCR